VDSNDSPKIVNIKKRDSNAKLSPFYVETKDFLKPSNRLMNNNNNNNNNNNSNNNNNNNTSSSNMSNSLNSFSNGARGNNFKRISINLEQVEIPTLITDTTATTTTTTNTNNNNNNNTNTTNNNNDRLNDKRNSLAPKEIAMMENSSYYGIRNEKLVKIVHK
jgi:hypothetical protein